MAGLITGLSQYNTDASPYRDFRDDLNRDWMGTSTKSAIRGRTLDEDREIKANLLDWIVGNSTAELTNQAQKRKAKTLRRKGDTSTLLSENINVGINDTEAQIKKKLAEFDAEKLAIDQVRATGEFAGDLNSLKGKGSQYVSSLLPELKIKQRTKLDVTDPVTIRANAATETEKTRYNEGIQYRQHRDTIEDNRIALERERMWKDKQEGRLNRAQDMRMNAENNAMQMQLEYSRLAQADANRSQDRKDKAIMALLGGLGNLGAGFTI